MKKNVDMANYNLIHIALSDFSSVVPKTAANPDGFARIFDVNGGKDASKMDAKSSDVISSEVP